MPFPTSLTAAEWATLEKFISGQSPPTRDVVEVAYTAEGIGLGYAFPAASAKNAVAAVAPMSKQDAIQLCKDQQRPPSAKALPPINWLALLQLLIQLFGGVIPQPTPTPTP